MPNLIRICGLSVLLVAGFGISSFTYADDAPPHFDCTLTNQELPNQQPGDAKDTFDTKTAAIYLICTSSEVEKDQNIKAVWIAADTHNVAPNNYKIDEKALTVTKDLADDQVFTFDASLTKPTNGWPTGSYHVDLYVDDQLTQSVKFTVE